MLKMFNSSMLNYTPINGSRAIIGAEAQHLGAAVFKAHLRASAAPGAVLSGAAKGRCAIRLPVFGIVRRQASPLPCRMKYRPTISSRMLRYVRSSPRLRFRCSASFLVKKYLFHWHEGIGYRVEQDASKNGLKQGGIKRDALMGKLQREGL
jgi:hypothetical protein